MTTEPRTMSVPIGNQPYGRDDIARIFDVPPALLPLTRCWLEECTEVAHVVLYASRDRLAGRDTRPRQPVVFCLKHGGQIYDQIRLWRDVEARHKPLLREGVTLSRTDRKSSSCPAWLVTDLRNDRLPRVSPDIAGWPAASAAALSRGKARK